MKKEKDITISVIIPTYKRTENLTRLLNSLAVQTLMPKEIIIVAAGYNEEQLTTSLSSFDLPISLIFSEPSVCHQRNIGISLATANYIQLCDDDIIIPNNYIEELSKYLYLHNDVNIVTGMETIQNSEGNWESFNQPISFWSLLYKYIFGLSVWSDLTRINSKSRYYQKLIRYFLKRGNNVSKAGWPILSNFSGDIVKAKVYGLGCAMFEAEILKKNPYSERLEQHGIGDNYDLAFRINKKTHSIHILKDCRYQHYKSESNRLPQARQYFNRTKALLNCLQNLPVFRFSSKGYFLWSLFGNGIYFFVKFRFRHFYENLRIIGYALIALLTTKKRVY